MKSSPRRQPNRAPTHPGEVLREDVLPVLRLSKTAVAEKLGISRVALYDILNERSGVSPEMAARLGKFLGTGPRLWLNMQSAYDLWHGRLRVK